MLNKDNEVEDMMNYKDDFMEWMWKENGITDEECSYCLSGSEIKAYYDDFIEKYKKVKSR